MTFFIYNIDFFVKFIFDLSATILIPILIYIIIQFLTDLNLEGAKYVKKKQNQDLKIHMNHYQILYMIIFLLLIFMYPIDLCHY